MGSVMGQIECPRCGSEECFEDYYYKTGEEYVNCPDCGYSRSFSIERGEDGKFVRKDETKGFEFDNLVTKEHLLAEPFGAYSIRYDDGMGSGGSLPTEEDYNSFVSDIVSLTNQPDHSMHKVTISRFVDGGIKKEAIWGTMS